MATLSGEATLTTTASFGTIDDVVLVSPIPQSHTTATKRPCAMEAILTAPSSSVVGWQTNSNGGLNGLNRSGSFAVMLNDSAVNYTDDEYTSDNYYTEDNPITYYGGSTDASINTQGLYSDKFVFDFQDIVEEATTNITSLTITATITASGSGSTSDIGIYSTSFGTSGLTDSRTLTANDQTTVSWTTTDIGTGHSGSFLPATVAFKCTDNPQTFQYDDITMVMTFTGRTYLRSGVVENDSITYKQINGSSTHTYDGVTYTPGAEVRIGNASGDIGGFQTNVWMGTDELKFNWNAGRFSNMGQNYTVSGMAIKEYINMVVGSSGAPDSSNADNIWGTSRFAVTDAINYQMTQDGSGVGSVFTAAGRLWKSDNSLGDVTANAGLARDDLAVPNFLSDDSITNIDNDDISTAITLTTEYTSADLDDRYLQFYSANINFEIEFRNGTKGSPTGNTAYKDNYGVDFGGGSYVESHRDYRSTPIPRNTKLFLEFFWRPSVIGVPDALDLSTTWTNSGLIGVKHGLTSDDVGTYTMSASATTIGGLLHEGASTPAVSFTLSVDAGFLLTIIEAESTTATLTATANLSIETEELGLTVSTSAVITVASLIFDVEATPSASLTIDFGLLGITHSMELSDVGAMEFVMTGVIVATSVAPGEPYRLHTFDTQTRTVSAIANTRTSLEDTQSRSIPVLTQTRIKATDEDTRTLTITGYST